MNIDNLRQVFLFSVSRLSAWDWEGASFAQKMDLKNVHDGLVELAGSLPYDYEIDLAMEALGETAIAWNEIGWSQERTPTPA